MSRRDSPPLEAILLPEVSDKPRRSWTPFIMVSIVVSSVLAVVGLGIWGFVRLVDGPGGPRPYQAAGGSEGWPARDVKQAQYRAVYRSVPAPVADPDLPQIERVMTQYVTAVKYDDRGALARLVDVDEFLLRMQEHPGMPRQDTASRRALMELLNRELQLPNQATEYRLMGIQRLARGEDAMVDVILKNANGSYDPCRFWLRQKRRAWTIIDWEMIKQGKSEAEQWVASQMAAQDWNYQSYVRCHDDLGRADRYSQEGNISAAIDAVNKADQATVPYCVQPELQFAIALRYQSYGQYQQAIDCCRNIQEPKDVPGVFVIRTLCYEALGKFEKALEAAAEYERLCGFAPDVVRAKAKSLKNLEKKTEATAEFRRLLDFDPADLAALQELAALLPADRKGEIAEIVARAKDPPQIALDLSWAILGREDEEALQAIADLLQRKWKDAAATHLLTGRIHLHEEEFGEGAAAFRRAFEVEKDPARKKQHWNEYVQAMMSAGKLVQAYEESPDAGEIFEHLTSGLEEGESVVDVEQLPPLIEAHRRKNPDDPLLALCTGHLARERGDLAAAEQALAAGEAKVNDEEMKSRLQHARMSVLADLGRILDAYRQYESLDSSFSTLAEECRQQQKPDVLAELLRLRRVPHPDDPDLEYYTAVLEVERGQFPQALQRLRPRPQPGDETEDEAGGSEQFSRNTWLKLDIYERYDQWRAALVLDPEFSELMPQLAARFEQAQEWDKLRELLDMLESRGASDMHKVLYEIKLAWNFRNYDKVESLVPRWESEEWKAIPEHERRWARVALVRSLLRNGKSAAAFPFAEQFQREYQDELLLLMTRIAQGEVAQVKDIFARQQQELYHNIAQDAELLPLLVDSRYAELRRELPIDLPSGSPRVSLVFFLREPSAIDAEHLRKLIEILGEAQVQELAATEKSRRTFRVEHGEGTIFVTAGDSPYFQAENQRVMLEGISDPAAKSGLSQHQAWIATDLLDSPAVLVRIREDQLAKRLASMFFDEKVLVIAQAEQQPARTRVVTRANSRPALLLPERPWKDWLPQGRHEWFSLSLQRDPSDQRPFPSSRKVQRDFAAAVAKLPAGQFAQVKVRLTLGHAEEELWMKVLRMEREEYGGYRMICELQQDSRIWPHLKSGEPCAVRSWQVRETKLPSAAEPQQAAGSHRAPSYSHPLRGNTRPRRSAAVSRGRGASKTYVPTEDRGNEDACAPWK